MKHPQQLTTNDQDEKPDRPSLRRPVLGGGCTQALAAQMLDAQETHKQLVGAIGDLSKVLDSITPQVIGVQTVVLDASGTASVQYRVPFQSLAIDSYSGGLLTVAAAPLQSAPPNAGPGVAFIRPGGSGVVNFRAYQWSLYGGQAGERVTVSAYSKPQPPQAAGGASTAQAAADVSVASSAASVPLFAPANGVNGRMIFNDSTSVLYVKFGATASTSSYSTQIAAGGLYEFPSPPYAGEVDGIWSSANGNARLTSW